MTHHFQDKNSCTCRCHYGLTHEELLAELNRRLQVALYNGDPKSIHSLIAVVELHKPFQVATGGSWTPEGSTQTFETACNHCGQLNSAAMVFYPCPTIQTIQKELK
jgi:hypothetical protein